MDITIKNVRDDIFRIFKAEAVKKGLRLGEAVNEAFESWARSKRLRKLKDSSRIKRAIEHMDLTRTPSEDWSGVREIRKWRERR